MSSTPSLDGLRCRVLLVDDDDLVLSSTEAVLSDEMNVVALSSPLQALRLLREDPEMYDVVCSDYRMPAMNGLELLRAVSRLPVHVGCLLITGADEYLKQDDTHYFVILKPFDPSRLIATILQLARVSRMKRSVSALSESRILAAPRTRERP